MIAKIFFTDFINNMEIRKTDINFGQRYSTAKILEVTTRKIFEPDGVSGYIETVKQLHGNVPRYTGNQGYRRYAEEVSEKILAKYPKIAKATSDIIEIANNSKSPFARDLRILVQPVLDRFGKTVDIVI